MQVNLEQVLIFASDALVRFRDGQILIHISHSPLPAFRSDQPMMLAWLSQFRRPTKIVIALAKLGLKEKQIGIDAIEYLQRANILLDVSVSTTNESEIIEADGLSRHHLKAMARGVYDLAADVLGLGPSAESVLRKTQSVGLESRLLALSNGIEGLRAELASMRENHLLTQWEKLPPELQSEPHKIHLGCGPALIDGWINIDVHPAPLSMNVLWGLPFQDQSSIYVFVSHLLEHLFFPRDVMGFLRDVFRVLKPGGKIRIVVPDVEKCISAYQTNDRNFFDSRIAHWPWWPANATRLEDFLSYAGVGPDPGYLFESHKYGYDFETLKKVLSETGFIGIAQSEYMQSADANLRIDHFSDVAAAKYGDLYYSLFVEATK